MSANFSIRGRLLHAAILYIVFTVSYAQAAAGAQPVATQPTSRPVTTFSLKAHVPGTKYNGRNIHVFETEGSDFVFSLFYPDRPPTNFSVEATTSYLTTLADPGPSDNLETLYTYGRSNYPRENGYGYLNTRKELQRRGVFKRDTWRCQIGDARQLQCESSFGKNFFVCGPYGWVYLRTAAPNNGRECNSVNFSAFNFRSLA